MALILTSDTARLVHASDPAIKAGHGYEGWIPASKVEAGSEGSATVVEVRPMTGVEFAELTTVTDLSEQLKRILPLCVISVDGDKAKAKEAIGWPWHLVSDLHGAIVTLSTGGELPLESAPATTEAG